MTQDIQPASPRARMRELLDELFDPESDETVHIPDLVDDITRQVDMEQVVRWPLLRQVVDAFVRDLVNQRLARTRGLLLMGDEVVTRDAFEKRLRQRANRFLTWHEHVGSKGHVQLMKMKKVDLIEAADERKARGMRELQIGALWESLAAHMTDDEEVGDRYSTEQIAELAGKLRITVLFEESNGPTVVEAVPAAQEELPPPPPPPAPPPAPTRRPRPAPAQPSRTPARGPASSVRIRPPAQPRPKQPQRRAS